MLEKLGIFGWQSIENVLFAAIKTGQAVLFLGEHGADKTEGAKYIANCIYPNANIRKYHTPTINEDELLGYPNPEKMKNGIVDYCHTPLTVWDKDVIIFDELNRANPFTVSKIMEIIHERQIMGFKLPVKLVFATANPANENYDVSRLDVAQLSKFCVIEVPNIDSLEKEDVFSIIKGNTNKNSGLDLTFLLKEIPENEDEDIANMVFKIQKSLKEISVKVSGRQCNDIYKLLMAYLNLGVSISEGSQIDIVNIVLSKIPEYWLKTGNVDTKVISRNISNIVVGFKLKDTITLSKTLKDLIGINVIDAQEYVKSANDLLKTETDVVVLKSFYDFIRNNELLKVFTDFINDVKNIIYLNENGDNVFSSGDYKPNARFNILTEDMKDFKYVEFVSSNELRFINNDVSYFRTHLKDNLVVIRKAGFTIFLESVKNILCFDDVGFIFERAWTCLENGLQEFFSQFTIPEEDNGFVVYINPTYRDLHSLGVKKLQKVYEYRTNKKH